MLEERAWGNLKTTQTKLSSRKLICLMVFGLFLSQFLVADDSEGKVMHTQVARDLFGKGGLFYKNQDFLSVYLEVAKKDLRGETQVNLLLTTLMAPDTLAVNPGLSRLQHQLINHSNYRQHFRTQLKLALNFGNIIWDSLTLKNKRRLRLTDEVGHERKKHSEAALFLGMLSTGGLVGLSIALGAPTFVAQLAPIVGLPITGILWRRILARPFTRNSRLELQWAEDNFKEVISNMGDSVCKELRIPKVNKTNIIESGSLTRVIKLAEHTDGSPLLVSHEDLMSVLHFRNSLPIYKGVNNNLQNNQGTLSYPAKELRNNWGTETILDKATVHTNVLIPVEFRVGSSSNEGTDKLDTLTSSLSSLLNNQTLQLKAPITAGASSSSICNEVIALTGKE